jgi:hypothetical protein
MKFNMGCGANRLDGWVNIDKTPACRPDRVMDLEALPWDIDSDCASEVTFNHSLEHMGRDPDVFLGILKELYRICLPDAKIMISVPHPRNDSFISDPTHVRAITPLMLAAFSKKNCNSWKAEKSSNTPFAIYLDIDFETISCSVNLESHYQQKLQKGQISTEDIYTYERERLNVATEYVFELRCIKN